MAQTISNPERISKQRGACVIEPPRTGARGSEGGRTIRLAQAFDQLA